MLGRLIDMHIGMRVRNSPRRTREERERVDHPRRGGDPRRGGGRRERVAAPLSPSKV